MLRSALCLPALQASVPILYRPSRNLRKLSQVLMSFSDFNAGMACCHSLALLYILKCSALPCQHFAGRYAHQTASPRWHTE